MKLKKLFAGIVAVAMMATMAMPGFAAKVTTGTTVNTTAKNGSVEIKVNYSGAGYGSDATGLEILNNGEAINLTNTSLTGTDYNTAKALKITTDTNPVTATEGQDTYLNVYLPEYTHVGTYTYKVKQVEATANGVTHDTKELYVVVHVVNADKEKIDGNLACKVAVWDKEPGTEGAAKIESITNTYTNLNEFKVTKTVKGSLGDRDQVFNFKIVLTKTAAVNATITFKAPNATEAVSITPAMWSGNTYTSEAFTMKHGQFATLANLPYGVTVQAFEVDEDGNSVGPKLGDYEVTNNGKTEEIKKNGATEIEITNKSTVNVDNGVSLDNAPYIALLTIVAAGAVVMIIKKRRNYED